jgi:hypothetical protein
VYLTRREANPDRQPLAVASLLRFFDHLLETGYGISGKLGDSDAKTTGTTPSFSLVAHPGAAARIARRNAPWRPQLLST